MWRLITFSAQRSMDAYFVNINIWFPVLCTHNILNSLRSAWTSLLSWYITLIIWIHCKYSSLAFDSDNSTSFNLGAGLESFKNTLTSMYQNIKCACFVLHYSAGRALSRVYNYYIQIMPTRNACQHCAALLPSCLSRFSGSGHDLDSCILIH